LPVIVIKYDFDDEWTIVSADILVFT